MARRLQSAAPAYAKRRFAVANPTGNESAKSVEDLAAAARDTSMEKLEGAKAQLAERAERVADAVDRTADNLEGEAGETVSSFGHSLAGLMRQLAGGLRDRDIDQFASELATVARRNPGIFLAGSVALGFGVARFFKAHPLGSQDAYAGGSWQDNAGRNWQDASSGSSWQDSNPGASWQDETAGARWQDAGANTTTPIDEDAEERLDLSTSADPNKQGGNDAAGTQGSAEGSGGSDSPFTSGSDGRPNARR
jgi:hypothetical protein